MLRKGSKDHYMSSEKFIKLWVEENHNNYDLLPGLRNAGSRSKARFGHGLEEAVAFSKDFHLVFYLPEEQLEKCAAEGYKFYVEENGLQKLTTFINETTPALKARVERAVTLDLKSLDDATLFDEWDLYGAAFGQLMGCYIMTQPYWMEGLEKKLNEWLEQHNCTEAGATLTQPEVEFTFSEKGSFFEKSFSELLKQEDAAIDLSIVQEQMYSETPINQEARNKVIKTHAIPDEIILLADILRGISVLRLKMRFSWMPAVYYNELFLTELHRRYAISKEDLRRYDEWELEALLKTGTKVDETVLEKRKSGFAKHMQGETFTTYEGEGAVRFIESITEQHGEVKELKGSVASKGHAIGEVIIFSYAKSEDHAKKTQDMKEGSILVTEMTRPNIVTALKKCGAIVTDEGGITSHAAIISRELQKPCIIGTKIATKVLKDGDMVEVDAEKGIVRIL